MVLCVKASTMPLTVYYDSILQATGEGF